MKIHASSIISKHAEIADDVEIGPFCVIEGKVRIGKGTIIDSHARIGSEYGVVTIGERNRIFAGAAVGGAPQDLKYKNESTQIIIGNDNQLRECTTFSIGTVNGGGTTQIGNNNLFMAYSHVGHDCHIGNQNVIANTVNLAGHVTIENKVTVGGMAGISQFSRLGSYSFIGGYSAVNKDVLPYSMASGIFATCRATNKIGLDRAGFSKEDIVNVNNCIRILTKSALRVEEAVEKIINEIDQTPAVTYLVDFVKASKRGLAI
jgi:UDP-N-acetylglucosamine acyltransferase